MNAETIHSFFLSDPSPETLRAIIGLYRGAGWWGDGPDDTDLVARLIRGSHCFLCIYEDKNVVGMGRAISDGVSDAYIQDVTVDKDFRHRGIGRRIVEKLITRLEMDGIGWIGLIAERDSYPFYRPLGFTVMEKAVPMLKRIK